MEPREHGHSWLSWGSRAAELCLPTSTKPHYEVKSELVMNGIVNETRCTLLVKPHSTSISPSVWKESDELNRYNDRLARGLRNALVIMMLFWVRLSERLCNQWLWKSCWALALRLATCVCADTGERLYDESSLPFFNAFLNRSKPTSTWVTN